MTIKKFQKMLYGGDYNPNQWPEEIWSEDMRIFKKAAINSATINVFSWARIQPSEEEFDFTTLDKIVEMLAKENYDIVFGTSTASIPGWMARKYPDVTRMDFEGRQHKFGHRHNACPNSFAYQKFARGIASKLGERYGNHPNVSCWHINNEYNGTCYCDNCAKAFRVWLRKRYGTIEALNEAWNLEFWGHTVYEWDEIVTPNILGEAIGSERDTGFAGLSIDYARFSSDSILDNFKMERDAIREFDQQTPVTTNLMGTHKTLDYFKWAKEMDIVSWDNYPSYNTPFSETAMNHDLMRGVKDGQSFMLMEQTPSQQNWQSYNSLKRPGQMRAQSWQSVAHGADTIQFFQLRRSSGACEKFHGAVIEHVGHENTRVFREVAQLGAELESFGDSLLEARTNAKVGIIFDWENYWSLEFTSGPNVDLTYVDQIHQYYASFYDRNIPVDMISVDSDFSQYDLVVAPVLYMVKEGLAERIERYVQEGGNFVTTFMSGIVDESDNVHLGGYPGPLRELLGIWVEEIDALAPEQSNQVAFLGGQSYSSYLLCDLMHTEGAEVLANYTTDFYAETPAITKNQFGSGKAWYVGTQLEKDGLADLVGQITAEIGIEQLVAETNGLEVTKREKEGQTYYFILNLTKEVKELPIEFAGKVDLLQGATLVEKQEVQPYDVFIVK